jgi:hypothetical protein
MLDVLREYRKSANEARNIGLCATCVHARAIESDRGSRFYFCGLSRSDSSFAKYPRLPVVTCSGYVKKAV